MPAEPPWPITIPTVMQSEASVLHHTDVIPSPRGVIVPHEQEGEQGPGQKHDDGDLHELGVEPGGSNGRHSSEGLRGWCGLTAWWAAGAPSSSAVQPSGHRARPCQTGQPQTSAPAAPAPGWQPAQDPFPAPLGQPLRDHGDHKRHRQRPADALDEGPRADHRGPAALALEDHRRRGGLEVQDEGQGEGQGDDQEGGKLQGDHRRGDQQLHAKDGAPEAGDVGAQGAQRAQRASCSGQDAGIGSIGACGTAACSSATGSWLDDQGGGWGGGESWHLAEPRWLLSSALCKN